MINLKDKVAIITGARRGMGRMHALILAQAGAKVAVSDISSEDCEKVVSEIEEQGGTAMAFKCDVTNLQEIEKMTEQVVEKWGKIDILVNNAGVFPLKPFVEMTEKDWDFVLDINLKGYFLTAKSVVPHMIKNGSGSIINISSIASGQVGIGYAAATHYVASKGGISGWTEALAVELAPYNIRVNAISPGLIDTPMIDVIKENKEAEKAILGKIPLARAGKPEEISYMVAFLASDLASYMTGSNVVIDGGMLAG
jgi:NAD(P)-dependent dehydrogenase (short-subunit alcohol dehydrogenase family)